MNATLATHLVLWLKDSSSERTYTVPAEGLIPLSPKGMKTFSQRTRFIERQEVKKLKKKKARFAARSLRSPTRRCGPRTTYANGIPLPCKPWWVCPLDPRLAMVNPPRRLAYSQNGLTP